MSSVFRPTRSSGRIGLAALALGFAFVIAVLFMGSYVGALHSATRTPHRLPIAVAGPPVVADQYAAALAGRGDAFDVHRETSPEAARKAVLDHDVYAALVPGTGGASTLIVADASGPQVADELAGGLSAAFADRQLRLDVQRVVLLPDGDAVGVTPFYAAVSWVFGGYLGAIVLSILAGAVSPGARLAAARIGGLLAYAVLLGLAGAVLLDPVFGALTGHFAALWAAGVAVVFGVAAITAGLQSLLGIAGTATALLLFLVASNPSAGGAVITEALPPFWRVIGPWLPTGAATTLIRNIRYFGGHHLAQPLLVLASYAVLGIVLVAVASLRRRQRPLTHLEAGVAAAGAGAGA